MIHKQQGKHLISIYPSDLPNLAAKLGAELPRHLPRKPMHGLLNHDQGRQIDWGETSADYATYRPGYPASFFRRLAALDIGLPGQRILDLGTGTGVLARVFAAQGCRVTGVDVAGNQIAEARRLAAEQGVDVEFKVAAAEDTGLPTASFDTIAASQAWLYFDKNRVIPEVLRLLAPGGCLLTCHFCWLPRVDAIARRTEELVLKFNPQWSAANWSGDIPTQPAWARANFRVRTMFYYDEPIPFTREAWRGRIRACRGVAATLSAAVVEQFDAEHAWMLEQTVSETFTVLHRIDCHIFDPVGGEMNVIETDRLTLEPLTAAHAEEMFAVLSDPAIYEFENQPPASVAALREQYRRWETRGSPDGRERWLNWVVRRRGAELIGYVQVTIWPTGRAGIAYEFNSRYWRRGYGREATQAMLAELISRYGVREFTAVLKRANFRSLGLLNCLGFAPAPAALLAQNGIEADEIMMHNTATVSPSSIGQQLPSSICIMTARCELRRFSRDDIPFVFAASRYPGFCDGMRWSPPATEAELIEAVEKNAAAWDSGQGYTFTIETKSDRTPVGRISIRRETPGCWSLGFWTHPAYQGRGYMTEAAIALVAFGFETLAAQQIEAAHATWNIASRRVLEKSGMRFTRHAPEGFQKDDRWVAEDILTITRQEWCDRMRPAARSGSWG